MFEEKISLSIKGNEVRFVEGTDIRVLAHSLLSFQKIVEKVYLYSECKVKMTDSDYKNLSIQIQNPHSGSWASDIFVEIKSIVLPLSSFVLQNSGDIMKTVLNVYHFLVYKIKAKDQDKTVRIQVSENSEEVNLINGDNNIVIINSPPNIPELAEELAPLMQKITKNIDGQAITEVEFGNEKGSIKFDSVDAKNFKTHTYTSDQIVSVSGIIREAKADNYSGVIKITASKDEQIIVGEEYHFLSQYNFSEEKFKSIYLNEIELSVKKRIVIGPENNFDGFVNSLIIADLS